MQLGWIDFSKTERSKILGVLELLQENGTLDELGIAPVRDGFSNLFFPGTSTIQTRAKYFMIIPYALRDLEYSSETNPNVLRRALDDTERSCGEWFLAQNRQEKGIIGGRSLQNHRWVKRPPVEIYWNGLRQYRIFTGGNLTLAEYLRTSCVLKKRRLSLQELKSRQDSSEREDWDDKDAGSGTGIRFWNLPNYSPNWQKELQMNLTCKEAAFLKGQIIATQPNSMLGYILREQLTTVLDCQGFDSLSEVIDRFPEHMQKDYVLALQFSEFFHVIQIVYNLIASDWQNEEALAEYERLHPQFSQIAQLDLDGIISRLGIAGHTALCRFLHTAKAYILEDDLPGLSKCIRDREVLLKGTGRAKTAHPGELPDPNKWQGVRYLDYRFFNAQTILRDIFEGEMTEDAQS